MWKKKNKTKEITTVKIQNSMGAEQTKQNREITNWETAQKK